MENARIELPPRTPPLTLPWPCRGSQCGFLEFAEPERWQAFIDELGIHRAIPTIVATKYARAQTLYLLGWFSYDAIKAGELAALVALELALTDRYGRQAGPEP